MGNVQFASGLRPVCVQLKILKNQGASGLSGCPVFFFARAGARTCNSHIQLDVLDVLDMRGD
jgi:hypothetical protein